MTPDEEAHELLYRINKVYYSKPRLCNEVIDPKLDSDCIRVSEPPPDTVGYMSLFVRDLMLSLRMPVWVSEVTVESHTWDSYRVRLEDYRAAVVLLENLE